MALVAPNNLIDIGDELNRGLVGYWPLNEGYGEITHDYSGNKNHGTLITSPIWARNIQNNGLQFNGSNQHVNINNQKLNLIFPNFLGFTISAWVKRMEELTSSIYISGKMGGVGQRGWQFRLNNNFLEFNYFDGPSGNSHDIISLHQIKSNLWTHCSFVFIASNYERLYINNILSKQQASGVLIQINQNNTSFLGIADRGDLSANKFNGLIKEVKIYNRSLSSSEITKLYNQGLSKINKV